MTTRTLIAVLLTVTGDSLAAMADDFDSRSIAAAIQQAKPGETVHLPAGTIALTEPIRPRSGLKILGAGQDKTRLTYNGEKADVFISINDCEDVELAEMTLDGQNNPLVHQGIGGGNSKRLWLHHLTIRNLKAKTWGPHAILFSGRNPTMEGGVTDSRINDCHIENIGLEAEYGGGIRLAWGSSRNQVLDNVIHNTGRGGIFGDHAPSSPSAAIASPAPAARVWASRSGAAARARSSRTTSSITGSAWTRGPGRPSVAT